MNVLSVEHVSKRLGERVLFEEVSFGLAKGSKVALVARNGAGKTSLLRILAGRDTPDTGEVITRSGLRMGYIEQAPDFPEDARIGDILLGGDAPELAALRAYDAALAAVETGTGEQAGERLEQALAEMDRLGAWDADNRMKLVLDKLGLPDTTRRFGELSGGQQRRVGLAQGLIAEPDVLILDEPTNHLDHLMIEWLEEFLSQSHRTLLMVTHDRYFLERVCNRILDLNGTAVVPYEGNYATYLEQKAERESQAQAEASRARNLLRKELEWVRRQPKARGSKSKYRLENVEVLKEQAQGPAETRNVELAAAMTRLGKKILDIRHLRKSFGEHLILEDFNYTFQPGERIGILGRNGVGKTTLLNLLAGEETADGGEVEWGETVVLGYFRQHPPPYPPEQRIIDVVKARAERINLTGDRQLSASQFLEQFLFEGSQQYTRVKDLSGGERKRLYLVLTLLSNPNFLILDEPTNDLDLQTLQALEDFLQDFRGCLLMVSHDRFLLNKLCNHLFVLRGGGAVETVLGNYHDYKALEAAERPAAPGPAAKKATRQAANTPGKKAAQSSAKAPSRQASSSGLSSKEKKELANLETAIGQLEAEKAELAGAMSAAGEDFAKLQEQSSRMDALTRELDAKTARWMELSERMEA